MCLAVPGLIEVKYELNDLPMARVNFGGVRRETCLQFVPEARVGEYVLVHVGFALSVVDEAAAQAAYQALLDSGENPRDDAFPDALN